jgi:DNA-directed RNA polymerase III subunit RPC8
LHSALTSCQDTVPVLPNQFAVETHEAITLHLNRKYANKVLQQVGFCVAVWDLIECGDGKVRWGDGKIWYKGESATRQLGSHIRCEPGQS